MNDLKAGYLIVYVMILTFITMSIGLSVLSVAGDQYTYVVDDVYRQDVAYGAKACAAVVAEELTADSDFGGFSNQVIFDDLNDSQGQVACSAAITSGPDGTKIANITTTMERSSTDPHPISYKMRAVLQAEGGGGSGNSDYLKGGILAGPAGFYAMAIGSITTDRISIIGKLYGSGNLYTIGTAADPIEKISVANVACGDSANWPQPCTTQPVTQWMGTGFQDIYADTCAPGQTTGLTKFKGVGLSTDCQVAATSSPGFDKASFVSGMTNTINATTLMNTGAGGCIDKVPIIPGYPQYGVRYYGTEVHIPANTRISGSLDKYYDGTTEVTTSSALQNGCTLVFDGDSYITGHISPVVNIEISDTASDNITMVINGRISVSKNQPAITPNSSGKLMHVISFYSSNSACSNSHVLPSATDPTCLTNSQAQTSSQIGSNAVPVDPALVFTHADSYDLSGVTFYAYYGSVSTGCSYLSIAAIGGQSVSGGCFSTGIYTDLTTTGSNPTFGDLIPSAPPEYKVVDTVRL